MRFFYLLLTLLFVSINSAFCADMRFIQVDNLLYSASNQTSIDMTEKLFNDINKQKDVKFIVFSGNNIVKPSKENLDGFLEQAKKLKHPYYIILGNKDVNKQKNLGKNDYLKIVSKKNRTHKKITSPNYVFEKKGLVFIVVDGSKDVIPTSMGYYKSKTLDWLEVELNKYFDKKIVILQHFPLIPPSKKESHYTFKAEEYLELLNSHNNVLAVISGHFGVDKEIEQNGILHISTTSAPNYKIIDILNYDSENPEFWSITKQ